MRSITISLLIAAILATSFCVGTTDVAYATTAHNDLSSPAEADLGRVIWQGEQFPNPGFEYWEDTYDPKDVGTWFSKEQYQSYVTAPWPVSEGTRSFLLQGRALVPDDYPEIRLTRGTWKYSEVGVNNYTLMMDWYVDTLPNPTDGDVFRLTVYLGAPGDREIHYYLGCQSTTISNSSWRGYFMIPGDSQVWNTLDRNITADHHELFGDYPTEFQMFHVYLTPKSQEYSRVLVDDVWLVNGTVVIGGSTENGNFESSSSWNLATNYEPGIISQSPMRQEGDYSLNMTVISNGNRSETRVTHHPYRWVSATNPDTFSFSWRLEDRAVSELQTYAYLYVSCSNGTDEFSLYYLFTYGDAFMLPLGNAQKIEVAGFNTTGQWNTFSRSIYDDVTNSFDSENLKIEEIEFRNYARVDGARTVLLVDGISLHSALMSDLGYESQGAPGSIVYAWEYHIPEFTVTSDTHTGAKAANLTLADSEYGYLEQDFGYVPVNENTDLWVDLFWYLDDNSEHTGNEVFMQFGFYDEPSDEYNSVSYYFLNSSPIESGEGEDAYILLDGINVEDTWHNMQRNLYDDYLAEIGSPLDGRLEYVYIEAGAASGGRVEILFDDVYLYTDPEPEITQVTHSPIEPVGGEIVEVNASVYDLSLDTVVLYYRVDNGSWLDIGMGHVGDVYSASIPSQSLGATVEYYVEATDSFGNVAQSSTSRYSVAQAPPPTPIIPPLVGLAVVVVVAIVIALLLYLFYFKPRQTAE